MLLRPASAAGVKGMMAAGRLLAKLLLLVLLLVILCPCCLVNHGLQYPPAGVDEPVVYLVFFWRKQNIVFELKQYVYIQ